MDMSAYYTSQDICFTLINDLPEPESFSSLKILEPSVGSGNFIPLLIEKYKGVPDVAIDLLDIDEDVLDALKVLLKSLNIPKNIKINFIHNDFILYNSNKRYNIVIGNPPFKKIMGDKKMLAEYRKDMFNKKTNNLFSFFIEKALSLSDYVAFITPKSMLSAPEFNKTRELLEHKKIIKIVDYGELAFDVKIETISFILDGKCNEEDLTKIESYILKETIYVLTQYITPKYFPYWIIYRNKFFDSVTNKLNFNLFKVFRDRQITKKITKESGKYRVLKSRNLNKNGEIDNILSYDCFVDDISGLQVGKFLNKNNLLIVPNLSYYPRAGFLPKNSIVDGSLAILIPENQSLRITKKQIDYFSTKEFEEFYKIARQYGTRSLNIDSNSVFFWGLLK